MTTYPAAGLVAATSAVTGEGERRAVALDLVGPTLTAILVEIGAALDPPVGRLALYPGLEVAWDDCVCGQAWVRLVNLLPSGTAPRTASGQPCGVLMWTATLGVGALRCAATVDDNGDAPAPIDLISDTLQMTADVAALKQALECDVKPYVEQLTFLRWDPLGPQGGCVGGEWQVQVKIGNCGCP